MFNPKGLKSLVPVQESITGWWYTYPLKNDGVKVSWDDEIPNMMGKNKTCSKPSTR